MGRRTASSTGSGATAGVVSGEPGRRGSLAVDGLEREWVGVHLASPVVRVFGLEARAKSSVPGSVGCGERARADLRTWSGQSAPPLSAAVNGFQRRRPTSRLLSRGATYRHVARGEIRGGGGGRLAWLVARTRARGPGLSRRRRQCGRAALVAAVVILSECC